jgi:hypothetical protein
VSAKRRASSLHWPERGVGNVALGDRALGRALVDAVVDIGADGTCTQTPMKEETR